MNATTKPRRLRGFLSRWRILRFAPGIVALVGFAGAVATLWPPIRDWLEPTEFRVYVLHPTAGASEGGVWDDFDEGLDGFLEEWKGRLDGAPLVIRDKYKLSFQKETWADGDEGELLQAVEAVLEDDRALALVAATNTRDSEVILRRLQAEDEPPVLLLALATKNSLLQEISEEGEAVALRGVFRMVPTNLKQAERLARTIVSSGRPPCGDDREGSISVAILREERENAAFSRDLAEALRRDLDGPQNVRLLVDSVVDSLVTVPRELVELQPQFLVYIGSQSGAALIYEQMRRLREQAGADLCLPQFILTDAGLLGDRHRYYEGLVPESVAALPLSSKEGVRANFGGLGADSGLLLRTAVDSLFTSSTSKPKLSRTALTKAMEEIEVEGQAHYYKFKDGENERADFHLWSVFDEIWQHDPGCNSDYHEKDDILAVESRSPGRPRHADIANGPAVRLRVGGKPFGEQSLLAAMAVHILEDAGIPASLGQVSLNGIRDLLLLGRIDAYWEYTGTALHRYHGVAGLRGPSALERIRTLDAGQVIWTGPLPVDNTYVLLARPDFAVENHIETITGLADHVSQGGRARLCANSEWFGLSDGLIGLEKAYEFEWPLDLLVERPLALIYHDAARCEVLVGYASDPEVQSGGRRVLRDDREFFPEYLPALTLREDVYRRIQAQQPTAWSGVEKRLACLADRLDVETMRELLAQLQRSTTDADQIARAFLDERCPTRTEGRVAAWDAPTMNHSARGAGG